MEAAIQTYHCACSALILATPYSLKELPTRKAPGKDAAIMLPLPEASHSPDAMNEGGLYVESTMHHIVADPKAIVVRRVDGFEFRRLMRCERCDLVVAYRVDSEQAASNVLFILPESLTKTEDMAKGSAQEGSHSVAQRV